MNREVIRRLISLNVLIRLNPQGLLCLEFGKLFSEPRLLLANSFDEPFSELVEVGEHLWVGLS